MKTITTRWVSIAVIVIGTFGCAQPEVPDGKFYRIYADPPAQESVQALDGVLVVRPFLADGLVSERSLIYGDNDEEGSLQQYHYHTWTESPTRMIQEQLVPYLRAANVAEEVITPEMRVDAKYELNGKIKRLEQIRGEQAIVLVELEVGLLEPRAGRLVFVSSYASRVVCADASIDAAVDGFSQAVSEVFAAFLADLRMQ